MSHTETSPDRKIRREALCWAATALIGKACTMLVSGGDMANTFCRYALADPTRHIKRLQHTHDLPQFPSPGLPSDRVEWVSEQMLQQESQDLAVNFVSESGTAQDCLDRGLSFRTLAGRSLWAFCAEEITALGGTDALYAKLAEQFEIVSLYWLPDPVVPWVEPLSGPLSGLSVLAQGRNPV